MAAELIATTATKKVYRDGDKAIKVFNADFPKAEVLNEALITARVEETGGIDVPKVLEVGVFEGKWSITFDFIEGKTLQQLMDENPDKLAEYMEQMVDLHLNILSKHCPLLNKLKEEMGLTILFIAHNLSVVKYFSDRIGVMYYGKLVEMADSDELFKNPMHPYTRALLSAIPEPDPINEKKRKKIHYDPEMHRYGDGNQPSYHEIAPGHTVYCSDEEFEEIKKQWKA